MHPWHDVQLGDHVPDEIPMVVEIPRGSKAKYALEPKSGLLELERILMTAARYPANCGFIPRTMGTDEAPVDVLVLGLEAIPPLTVLKVRPIGGMRIKTSDKGYEDKVIGVFRGDPEASKIQSIRDVAAFRIEEIRQFFETYKMIDRTAVRVKAFFGRPRARQLILESVERYEKSSEAA